MVREADMLDSKFKAMYEFQTTAVMSSLDDITLLLRSFHDLENNNTEIDPLHYDFGHHVDDLNRT